MNTLRQNFLNHLAQTSDFPMGIEIASAEGNYLIDRNGKKYIDLISGIAVSNLGHANPHINAAIVEQLNKNMHVMVYGEFILSPQVKLATELCKHLPAALNSVYLVNSGSEAVEGAMKLTKRFTGRPEIICFKNAYHGSTQGALSIIGNAEMQQGFHPLLPGIRHLEFNSLAELDQISQNTAAVFIEPIQGEAGVRIADKAFLEALRKKCSATGTLLVFDEIQSGYGRSGKLFAFEHFDITPDILLLAKGFGGGMPLGAFISDKKITDCLLRNPVLGHITTFGGHPVSCAASLAALKILTTTPLVKDALSKGELFKSLLIHPKIKEVRGTGLMLAVELPDFDFVQKVIADCIENGLISDWFLFADNCLRIAPPLTITEEEIRKSCATILAGIQSVG